MVEVTVGKWRGRFVAQRIEGLRDEHHRRLMIEVTIVKTLESLPKDATLARVG